MEYSSHHPVPCPRLLADARVKVEGGIVCDVVDVGKVVVVKVGRLGRMPQPLAVGLIGLPFQNH